MKFMNIKVTVIPNPIQCNVIKPSTRVALKSDSYVLHKILPNKVDPLVSLMMVEKVPDSTYEMIGGLEKQIKEIKAAAWPASCSSWRASTRLLLSSWMRLTQSVQRAWRVEVGAISKSSVQCWSCLISLMCLNRNKILKVNFEKYFK